MTNQLGTSKNLAARFFVTGLQPGPAQPDPARFAEKEASPAQPSPLAKMASPTIPDAMYGVIRTQSLLADQ